MIAKTMQVPNPSVSSTGAPSQNVINSGLVEAGEVLDVILDETHERYTGIKDIGKIFVRRVLKDYCRNSAAAIEAYPMFPYLKNYPVRFEIVMLIKGPSNLGGIDQSECYYYLSPYNIWGLINHNALPYASGLQVTEHELSDRGGYLFDLALKAAGDEPEFGNTFKEQTGVPILQPYEGDIIFHGRWGNSIRFGSSTPDGKPKNTWSINGTNGDPITILCNTKPKKDKIGQIAIEDINENDSSIYLCTNQKIELETASENYKAYKNKPVEPKYFQGNQVIICSDRIVFNTKKSDLLLYAKKSIGLSSDGTINLSANKEFIVDASKHYIGAKAEEPLMFGKKTKQWLSDLINAIKSITVPTGTGPSGTPVNAAQFDALAAKLDKLLSQKAFVE